MEKEIKVTKNDVTVTVRVPEWKPGRPKLRVYESTVRAMISESYPNVPLGKCLSGSTFRTTDACEAAWVFEIIQKQAPSVKEIKEEIKEKTDEELDALAEKALDLMEYGVVRDVLHTPVSAPKPKTFKKRTLKKEVISDKTDSSD